MDFDSNRMEELKNKFDGKFYIVPGESLPGKVMVRGYQIDDNINSIR